MEKKDTVRTTNSGEAPTNPDDASVPNSDTKSDGQHVDHWILSDEERGKGYIRPVRLSYVHNTCGGKTSMPRKIAETYAVRPTYYGSTFCCSCGDYFPVKEFVWQGTKEILGS